MTQTHTQTYKSTESIYTITGKRWTKAGHDRMYITVSIEKDGHTYKELSKAAAGCLIGGDWWVDMQTGVVMHKDIPSKVSSWHVKAVEEMCAKMYTELTTTTHALAQEAPKEITTHPYDTMTEDMVEDMGDMCAYESYHLHAGEETVQDMAQEEADKKTYADLMVTYDVMDVKAEPAPAPKKSRIITSLDDLASWDIDQIWYMVFDPIFDTGIWSYDDAREVAKKVLQEMLDAKVYDQQDVRAARAWTRTKVAELKKAHSIPCFIAGEYTEACDDTELVYKGKVLIEDDIFGQLTSEILFNEIDKDDSKNFTEEEIEVVKNRHYFYLTPSEVLTARKDFVYWMCKKFWTIYTESTTNNLEFVSEKGVVTVTFADFFEDVFTFVSDRPQKDITNYLKKTYQVA